MTKLTIKEINNFNDDEYFLISFNRKYAFIRSNKINLDKTYDNVIKYELSKLFVILHISSNIFFSFNIFIIS